MDRRGRDQFVIRYGDETEVCWNDHQKALAEQVSCLDSVVLRFVYAMPCHAMPTVFALYSIGSI